MDMMRWFSLLHILSKILGTLCGYINGLCPTGCYCNKITDDKTHLLCDHYNLKSLEFQAKPSGILT